MCCFLFEAKEIEYSNKTITLGDLLFTYYLMLSLVKGDVDLFYSILCYNIVL
jgi:hypothetical protein